MSRYIDLTNQRFGRLLVLKDAGRKFGQAIWRCHCDCGNITIVHSNSLRRGLTKSCALTGCSFNYHRKHGAYLTQEYGVWRTMLQRCNNPKSPRYKDYGARGIRVCKRWGSFEKFITDMGPRPKGYSIERINNNGNYTPRNCKWIPLNEQHKNKRR